ncbi:hypothetical protein Ahia01_000595800, partial [Argonauta hians]
MGRYCPILFSVNWYEGVVVTQYCFLWAGTVLYCSVLTGMKVMLLPSTASYGQVLSHTCSVLTVVTQSCFL